MPKYPTKKCDVYDYGTVRKGYAHTIDGRIWKVAIGSSDDVVIHCDGIDHYELSEVMGYEKAEKVWTSEVSDFVYWAEKKLRDGRLPHMTVTEGYDQ